VRAASALLAGVTPASSGRVPIAPRHSAAALRAGRNRGTRRSIAFAFGANLLIAAAKLAAGLVTRSTALLAEAVHSAADSINETLLWLSLRRAQRPADALHPFGYGGTRFLWAFLAAITSFLIGGCVSTGLDMRELLSGGEIDRCLDRAGSRRPRGRRLARSKPQAGATRGSALGSIDAGLPTTHERSYAASDRRQGRRCNPRRCACERRVARTPARGSRCERRDRIALDWPPARGDRCRPSPPARRAPDRQVDGAGSPQAGIRDRRRLPWHRPGSQYLCGARCAGGGHSRGQVHPSPGQTGEELARLLDELDRRPRGELPRSPKFSSTSPHTTCVPSRGVARASRRA
jgi:hypothetical protein